jgi:hypothetical protein
MVGVGSSSTGVCATTLMYLTPITGLTATTTSSNSINLAWNSVTGALSYWINSENCPKFQLKLSEFEWKNSR